MERLLDELQLKARRSSWLARLAVCTRILLAAAFIPTGLVKILNQRFTSLPPSHPVGALFEALFQTGGYWQFLGWTQVVAGLLLLVPATAAIGALLFLAIAVNIFVITATLGFVGTPVITGLMLLAVLFLVCWDYHRWRGLLFTSHVAVPPAQLPLRWRGFELSLLWLGGASGLLFFLGTRSLVPGSLASVGLVAAALAAVVVGALWIAQDLHPARRTEKSAAQN